MNHIKYLTAFGLVITHFGVNAQTLAPIVPAATVPVVAAPVASPLVVGDPATKGSFLPQGTRIRLRTLSQLSSKDNKVGDLVDLEVAEEILLDGRVVIPRGSSASGDVSLVKKKGMWGKSGKLEARVLSITVGGRRIPVRGQVGDKGDTGTAAVVGSILVLPLAGFFVTGTSAILPAGTGASATLENDLPVVFAQAPAPAAAVTLPK
jgi:hypothetical protein